jgi:hypothetical protein
VLVDTARPDAVAHEMGRTLQELKKTVAAGTCSRDGRILFLDWSVLGNLGAGAANTATTVNDLGRYFGGCLAWKPKTAGGLRNASIEPIWSWREATAFGEIDKRGYA